MSQRNVARKFGVTLRTVQRWVERAQGKRLDRVDWTDASHRPETTTRISRIAEDQVLNVRTYLRDESTLGSFGADAILEELRARSVSPLPSRPTIVRIVRRRGAIERHKRQRRPPPPRGWYLHDVAHCKAELDSFDYIDSLRIQDGPRLDVLTGVSLHGGLPAAFPVQRRSTKRTCEALVRHWRKHGLPDYAQFDNDTVFQGAHQFRDTVGRVTRLCMSLGITVVFAAPREHGPQNLVEGFNAKWQAKVWHRFTWTSLTKLKKFSDRYLTAVRRSRKSRLAAAPARRPFPEDWSFDPDAPLRGTIIYLRRLDDEGRASLLGHQFAIDRDWAQQLVRCEVRLGTKRIAFFGLTRRDPHQQPHLKTAPYSFPQKPFQG